MAAPHHLVLGPGVSLREVDDYLVAEKPGMRVKVRDARSMSVLKRASLDPAGGPAGGVELDATIEALVNCGLLEAGPRHPADARPPTNDYLVSLQGRYEADLVADVRHRLAKAGVAVVGEPWLGAQIIRALAESGVGSLTMCDLAMLPAGKALQLDLVVDLTWPAAGATAGSGDDEIAVLPAVWNVDEIVVGPVLGGGRGRCRSCAGPKAGRRGWVDASRPDKSLGAGLASAAALSYLSGLSPSDILTMSLRYDLRTRQSESVLASGDIACPACGVRAPRGRAAAHPTAQLAWRYEEGVAVPIVRYGGVARWSSVRSQSVFRRRHFNMPPLRQMAEARGMALPGQVLSLLDSALETDPVVGDGKVAGIRYRRLPTVEGVGTSSVYLLPREQDGLIHGGAYYDAYAGELIPLSWPIAGGGGDQPATSYRVCITGNFTGADVCFGRFGRRVVFQDAGLLFAHLLHGGSRVGLRPAMSAEWSPGAIHSALDLAAGEAALAVIDLDIAAGSGTVSDPGGTSRANPPEPPPSGSPEIDSWLSRAIESLHRVAPSVLDELVLYCLDGDEELSELQIGDGKYLGRTHLDGDGVHRDALRAGLIGAGAERTPTIVIGADLQAAVYQRGAAAYASLIQRAAALAHYLSLVASELGTESQLMLKLPARLLERSLPGGGSRLRVLSALATAPPGGAAPGSSGAEVSL